MNSLFKIIISHWRFTLAPLLLTMAGCGGGGGNPTEIVAAECSIKGQNQFVYDVMKDFYLYYDQVPVVNPSDYSSPEDLLLDLRVAPDRFSSIADTQTQQQFFEEGTYNGIGFSYNNEDDRFTVSFVFDDSSAGRAGLKRSDQIVSIEGILVTQINNDGGLAVFLSNYNENQSLTFSVISSGAAPVNKEMSKGLVQMNTVLKTEVLTTNDDTANSTKIGYLAFSSFIQPSKAELATAFNTLKQQNIDELVLDLRYNGGGRVDTAQVLASYIAGDNAVGDDVTKLIYNDRYSDLDNSFPFLTIEDSLDINRLYVLTLDGTCSASELLINAMQPVGVEVVTIGQTTCGKPIGFRPINFCDKTLSAASFNVVNDINQGDYFEGIAPTCAANDDLSKGFADPNEGMFAAALYHIEYDQCPAASKVASKKLRKTKRKQINPANIMESVY